LRIKYKGLGSVKCMLLFIPMMALSLSTEGQSYSHAIFDNKQSEHFGADNLMTLHHVLYAFEDRYLPDTLFRKNTIVKRTANFSYRLARLFFVDAQIDGFIALSQHEVFGHGARYREFGYKNNSFNLNLYPPFGSGHGSATRGQLRPGYKMPTYQENIAISTSGVEAEMLLANDLTSEMLLNDTLHYRQGLLYLISQNNELLYLWWTRFTKPTEIQAGNDMANYISGVNYLYSKPGVTSYDIKKLSAQSLISIANPIQAYSVVSIVYSYLIKGQKGMKKIPMIPLGKVGYLPAFNYSLTPFGSQYHFMNYLRYKRMLFSCDIGIGDNTFKDFYGISVKGYNIVNEKWITLNFHADFWNQPELELDHYIKPVTDNKPGGACKIDVILRPFKLPNRLGIFVQTGYKAKGYLEGETLAESFILRFGFSLHL
jgi:hypothetical protein